MALPAPLPPLAEVWHLTERMGDGAVTDEVQAIARLADASSLVRSYAGTDWIDDDGEPAPPPAIPGLVAGMVERAVRNPMGATQTQAGPFGVSFGPEAASRIYLTAAEKQVIRQAVGRSNIGVLSTSRGSVETHREDWWS